MKNKKPLQFVKELPSHAELWKIVDETIMYPGEGLSIAQIKYYMYTYLCISSDFSTSKHLLQTDMSSEDLHILKMSFFKEAVIL